MTFTGRRFPSILPSLSLPVQDVERGERNRTGEEAGREPEAGRCCPHALTVLTCSITTHPLELVTWHSLVAELSEGADLDFRTAGSWLYGVGFCCLSSTLERHTEDGRALLCADCLYLTWVN